MPYFNQQLETLPRDQLVTYQAERLHTLLAELDGKNRFYTHRLRALGAEARDFTTLDALKKFPFTTKQELSEDQIANPPFGTNLTYPENAYTRYHQTSGTTGKPLKVFDTAASWDWWGKCWGYVLAGAGLTAEDRLFIAFSFGPFIGFWAAVEGARYVNAMMIPGGGRDSLQRLELMRDASCTALCCTPTYALRLAEVAREAGFDLRELPVRATIHAGEPGANVPATKRRIEEAWAAKCYDHAGATEVGAHSFECEAQPGGVHLNETEFIAEVINPETGALVAMGQKGELVLTTLGRFGFPVIRYRTGDIVQLADEKCACGRTFVRCQGGIIGRADDMVTVRGVNVYPSAIENLVRAFAAVDEFRVTVAREGELDVMRIEIECAEGSDSATIANAVAASINHALGLRPVVESVGRNTLPRFELKARRFHVKR
jgi:phenylacetate-CoA ligase